MMEVILGHCTWVALLRRETLSLFSAVHAFVQLGGTTTLPL
jgi:hypothetical protein